MSVVHKKKVLHIIDSFGSGGAETWLLACVKYLHEHPELNVQFDFLASGGKKGVFDDEIRAYGANIYYQKYSLKKFFGFSRVFKKILNENNYIAVHDHQDFITGWHYLAGGKDLPGIRISHLHNSRNFVKNYVTNPFRWFSFKVGRLLMFKLATKITATSNVVMDEYGYNKAPYKNKRVNPTYCGFETDRFIFNESAKADICNEFMWRNDSILILFAGRIGLSDHDSSANEKNPAFAFEIAKILAGQNDGYKFIFAGHKGDVGKRMEDEAGRLGLGHQIKFPGIRKDIPLLMSAADVLLFPSLREGLGMVAVEAQAAGLKIVASDSVPEEAFVIPEIITRKSLLTPIEDWVGEVVLACNHIINRKDCNKSIRNSTFSIKNSVKNLLRLYDLEAA